MKFSVRWQLQFSNMLICKLRFVLLIPLHPGPPVMGNQAWGQVQGIVLESKYKYIATWQVQVQVQVQVFDRVLESKYKYF